MATLDEILVQLGIDADDLTDGARQAADRVEDALDGIAPAMDAAADGVQDAADRASSALDGIAESADGAAQGAEQAAGGITESLRGVAAAAAGAAVGAAFMSGLNSALDASAANTRLTNQLDLTAGEAARAGDVAGTVFSAGFGASIDEVNVALGGVASSVGSMGDLTNAELRSMTTSALALADTFEFDVAESTQAVGTLIKAGLVKDGVAGFDLLAAAAQKMPGKLREELPGLTSEYTTFFDQLGFTGPQMFGLLTEAAKNPVFELDKVADAVKELSLVLSDTEAASEPLKALGLDIADIQELINKGQGTEAFDQITTALKGVEDQTERTALQAALFGGPGEDMGNSLLELNASGAAASTGLDDAAGAADRISESMQASPAQQFEATTRTLAATLGDVLAPALQAVSTFAAEHPAAFQAIAIAVGVLALALGIAAIAQWAMNSAMLANPITWIIIAVIALVAAIVWVATQTTFFQDAWAMMTQAAIAAWDWFWGLLKAGWDMLVDLFMNWTGPGLLIKHWDSIKAATGAAIDWVEDVVQSGVDHLKATLTGLGSIVATVTGFFGRIHQGIVTKISAAIDWLRGLKGRVMGVLSGAGSWLTSIGRSIIQGLINGVTGMIGSLRNRFSSITAMIPDWKGPMTVDQTLLTPSGEAVMGGFMDGVDDSLPALREQLHRVTTDIPRNLGTATAQAGMSGGSQLPRLVIDVTGADEAWKTVIREIVRVDGGGSAELAFAP